MPYICCIYNVCLLFTITFYRFIIIRTLQDINSNSFNCKFTILMLAIVHFFFVYVLGRQTKKPLLTWTPLVSLSKSSTLLLYSNSFWAQASMFCCAAFAKFSCNCCKKKNPKHYNLNVVHVLLDLNNSGWWILTLPFGFPPVVLALRP